VVNTRWGELGGSEGAIRAPAEHQPKKELNLPAGVFKGEKRVSYSGKEKILIWKQKEKGLSLSQMGRNNK